MTLFEKEKEEKKKERKKFNNILIKNRIIRYIRTLFEQHEVDYYKPNRVRIYGIIIILSMKVMVISIETYDWTNILTEINLT